MNNNRKNRVLKYSIRRLSIGVVSVIVGAFAIFGASTFENSKSYGVVYADDIVPEKYKNNKVSVVDQDVTLLLDGFSKYLNEINRIHEVNIMFESDGYNKIKMEKYEGNGKAYKAKIDKKYFDKKGKFKIEIKENEIYIYTLVRIKVYY